MCGRGVWQVVGVVACVCTCTEHCRRGPRGRLINQGIPPD